MKVFALRAATGQAGISRDVLKDASRAIENVDQPSQKFSLLLRLANSYAKDMEKPISAKAALKEAEALLPELPDHEKLAGRIRLSGSLELAGEAERSQEMLAAALEEANNLEDGRAKAEALGDAAAALFELERNEEASAHLQTAEEAAAGLNDAESRSHALSSLGRKLMMCGQNAKAGAMLKKAMSAAEEVGDPTMRNSIMDEINASKRLLAE